MSKHILLLACLLFTINLFAQPVIHSFAPASGPIGTVVTIKGTGFSPILANNVVYFGAVKGAISSATDTTLTVTVPSGATHQPITVTTHNLTAYSVHPFILTYPAVNKPFTATSFTPKKDITTGTFMGSLPHNVSMADFNDDGKIDLVVPKGSASTVSVFANTSSSGIISFGPNQELPAKGNSHEGSAIGDLDGDGKLDFVIVSSFNANCVSVHRNTSNGGNISFAPKIDYEADHHPYAVVIGDLNNDGKPDIALGNGGSNVVSIYKNKSTPGSISFDERVDFTVGTYTYGIALNDLDKDGKADLAITCQGSSSGLFVLKNTTSGGSISFGSPTKVAYVSGSYLVSIADIDGDSWPDLAAASAFSNSIIVVKNTSTPGNLSFYSPISFTTGTFPEDVAFDDLDGDGKPEMVTINNHANSVSVLKNTSTKGNISFAAKTDYAVGPYPSSVAIGDLDGDGRPDIAVGNTSANTVSILKNIMGLDVVPAIASFSPASGVNGTIVKIKGSGFTGATSVKFGGTEAASFTVDSATGITATVGIGASGNVAVTTAYGVATHPGFQFNGPIIHAFVPVSAYASDTVLIAGTNFTEVTEVKFGGTPASSFKINSPTSITATVGNGTSGNISITSPNGTATLTGFTYSGIYFTPPSVTSIFPGSGPVGTVVTITGTNFNPTPSGNIVFFGAVKAVVSAATPTQLTVAVPSGATYKPVSVTANNLTAYSSQPFTVTFDHATISEESFVVAGNYPTGSWPIDVVFTDLNDDGKPDLVTANGTSNNISVFKNTSTKGTISLSAKTDFATGPGPRQIAVDDLDGDGKPDLVVANLNSGREGSISIFRNTSSSGSISFAPRVDFETGLGTTGVDIGDLNADGKPDIVAVSGNSYYYSIFQNITPAHGNITFALKQDYPTNPRPDNVAIADVNADGRPEIIIANSANSSISVYRNISMNKIIEFASRVDYPTNTFPTNVKAGDFDQDGKLDLAITNYTGASLTVYKNHSSGNNISLGGRQDYPASVYNLAIGDLNGDGRPDISGGSDNSGHNYIWENLSSGTGGLSFAHYLKLVTGEYRTVVSVGDLDGDSKPEMAVVHSNQSKLVLLRNRIGEPVIISVTPMTSGAQQTVTLTGSNFTNVTSVKFGGVPAQSFHVVSPTMINATIGEGASGTITVATQSGTAGLDGFRFIPGITTDGPTTFCAKGAVTLRSTAVSNNQWYKDGVVITGATASVYNATTSGTYTVRTTSNGITTSADSSVTVSVITTAAPVITVDANKNLLSSAHTGNQWFFNGNEIPGATGQVYQPKQAGSYTVRSSFNDCISDFSDPYNITLTGIIDLGNGQFINMYPNPVKDRLFVTWNIDGMPPLQVEVMDLQGKQLLVYNNLGSGTPINLSQLPPGIYLIKVYNRQEKNTYTVRIYKAE